ncbi:MAG TPA: hypothetical protein VGC95_01295, partial [Chitinophagaceae bacterium]
MNCLLGISTPKWSFERQCKFIVWLLLIGLPVCRLHAQRNLQNVAFREKVFIHTDKSLYITGDIIWFKVYACDARDNRPDQVSRIAYVELLTADNRPALQAKISLSGGTGTGSFQLPTSLLSGNYVLRGYTSWMKNFSPGQYFHSMIGIVNTFKPSQLAAVADSSRYDIGFFPEGGNLVTGVENTVGFKVLANDGSGPGATGNLFDEANQMITSFNTLRNGMGSFRFTPVAGKKYHAVVTIGPATATVNLPDHHPGYAMHVETDNPVTVRLQYSGSDDDERGYLVISQGGDLPKQVFPVGFRNHA